MLSTLMIRNVSFGAILQACRPGNHQLEYKHVYTMSFTASPWDFPETFQRIPRLTLRAAVDPTSWEVTDMHADLVFDDRYTDIMFPSL